MPDDPNGPMIGKTDRPTANLDARVSDVTVRDLAAALGAHLTERVKPEFFKPETFKPEQLKPEQFKPEGFKPEGLKPETFKPEGFKPELIKPELLKEAGKPEIKPDPIDQLVTQLVNVLSADQLKTVAGRLNDHLAGNG